MRFILSLLVLIICPSLSLAQAGDHSGVSTRAATATGVELSNSELERYLRLGRELARDQQWRGSLQALDRVLSQESHTAVPFQEEARGIIQRLRVPRGDGETDAQFRIRQQGYEQYNRNAEEQSLQELARSLNLEPPLPLDRSLIEATGSRSGILLLARLALRFPYSSVSQKILSSLASYYLTGLTRAHRRPVFAQVYLDRLRHERGNEISTADLMKAHMAERQGAPRPEVLAEIDRQIRSRFTPEGDLRLSAVSHQYRNGQIVEVQSLPDRILTRAQVEPFLREEPSRQLAINLDPSNPHNDREAVLLALRANPSRELRTQLNGGDIFNLLALQQNVTAPSGQRLRFGHFIPIELPRGAVTLGSPAGEEGRFGDEDEREVHLTRPFTMGDGPVTQLQWYLVMGTNPSHFSGGPGSVTFSGVRMHPNRPVENVSWNQTQEFIRRLNGLDPYHRYRLPTEAEWEYAARGGTRTRYSFGNNTSELRNYAWYSANSERRTHDVGELRPNLFGLYDVYGNVWQWVQDWYTDTPEGGENPTGPSSGDYRVRRGGGWDGNARNARSACRGNGSPGGEDDNFGFRLVRVPIAQ